MWVGGTISLAQSYIAGKVADTVLHAALEAEGPGAAAAGPAAFLVKPLMPEDIEAALRSFLTS